MYLFLFEDGEVKQADSYSEEDKIGSCDGYLLIVRYNETSKQFESLDVVEGDDDKLEESWTPLQNTK